MKTISNQLYSKEKFTGENVHGIHAHFLTALAAAKNDGDYGPMLEF